MAKINLDVVVRVPKTQEGVKELKEQFRSLAEEFGKIKVDSNFQASVKAITEHYKALGKAVQEVTKHAQKQQEIEKQNAIQHDNEKTQMMALEKQYASAIEQIRKLSTANKDYGQSMKETLKDLEDTWAIIKQLNKGTSDYALSIGELSSKLAKAKTDSASLKMEYERLTKATKEANDATKSSDDEIYRRRAEEERLRIEAIEERQRREQEATNEINRQREESERLRIEAINEIQRLTEEAQRQERENSEQIAQQRREDERLRLEAIQERQRREQEEHENIVRQREEEERLRQEAHDEFVRRNTEQLEQAEQAAARRRAGLEWERRQQQEINSEIQRRRQLIDQVLGQGVMRIWRTWFSELKTILDDVNDVLTKTETTVIEIQRVLDDNVSDNQISSSLYKLAQKYGQTFENASTIAQNFAKTGMSWNDTLKATESALLAMNVAELNASQSSEGLLSVLVQFKKEASDLETVVDQLNKTADKNPVTTEKLLKALQRTGSAAVNANLSLEETLGIITTLSASTNRSGQNLGTATNALIMYTRNHIDMFAELSEESRKAVENFKAGTGSLLEVWRTAQEEIERLRNNKARFNSLLDLFGGTDDAEELNSTLHDELNDIFDQTIGIYKVANTYRQNYFIALLDNIDRIDKVLGQLEDAQGYSQEENLKYMETYEAKVNTLEAKWQSIANDEQGLLKLRKHLVELGTGALDYVKKMGGIVAVIQNITGLVGGLLLIVKSAKIVDWLHRVVDAVQALATRMTEAASASEALSNSFSWVGIAVIAFTALYSYINAIDKQMRDQIKTNIETAESSRANAHELGEQIKLLDKLTPADEEYRQVQDKIVSLLGDRSEALKDLKKDSEEYIETLKDLTEAELNEKYADEMMAAKSAKADILLMNTGIWSGDDAAANYFYTFAKYGKEGVSQLPLMSRIFNPQPFLEYQDNFEELEQKYEEFLEYRNELSAEYREKLRKHDSTANDTLQLLSNVKEALAVIASKFNSYKNSISSLNVFDAFLNWTKGGSSGSSGTGTSGTGGYSVSGGKPSGYGKNITGSSKPVYVREQDVYHEPLELSLVEDEETTGETKDEYLEALKSAVALRKSELTLMQHQKASLDDQVAKNKEIQEALHIQAEYLRQTGADQAEINALSSEWYNIQENITKLIKSRYTDEIDLAKSRLTLMEHQEASVDKQVEQMKEIQRNLHEEADYLRQIGAEETEINALSSEWWTWQEKILKLYQDTLNTAKELELEAIEKVISSVQEEIDLREEELNLAEKQLAVYQAMDALEEARAKARAEYVSQVLSDYITALSDAQTLDEKQKAVSEAREKYATAQREAQTKAIVEAMKAQKDLGKDALSLEEKRLAVEEARQALIDAQNDRTTRVYDEATGEWHYETNAQNVKSAQEKLADAMQSLDDYLEGEAWDEILDKMEEGSLSEGDILAIIEKWQSQGYGSSEWGNKIIEAYSIAIGTKADPNSVAGELDSVDKAINSLNDYLKNQAIKELQAYIKDGNTSAAEMQAIMDKWLSKGEGGEIWSWSAGVLSEVNRAIQSGKYDDTKIESQVKAVSTAIENLQSYLDKQFLTRIKTLIATGSTEDVWNAIRDAEANGVSSDYIDNFKRQAAYKAEKDSIEEFYKYASAHPEDTSAILKHMEHNSEMWKNSDWKELYADANAALGALIGAVRKNGIWYKNGERLYDSGGVLRGTGGIKGTSRPEGVLDPELTAKILTPRSEEQFNAFVRAMNIMLDHGNRAPSANPVYNNASSVDSHNVTHMINGVPITQDMAQRYTIAELCEVLPILN